MKTKECTKCGIELEATIDNFHKASRSYKILGSLNTKYKYLRGECKKCISDSKKVKTPEQRQQNIKYQKEYRIKNKEKIALKKRESYLRRKEALA